MNLRSSFIGIVFLVLSGMVSSAYSESLLFDPARLKESKVRYREYKTLSEYPYPVLHWKRAGLANDPKLFGEIKEKILYPLINESEDPILAIVVEFIHTERGQIGIDVIWADGRVHESFMEHNEFGKYDPNSYKIFFKKSVP